MPAIGYGVAGGMAAGAAEQLTFNLLTPCTVWHNNLLEASLVGRFFGGLTAGAAYGVRSLFTRAISTAPALNTSNEIGAWGEQQVGANLPVQIQHVRPVAGQPRIYDGYFTANPNAYVEVKTSTQGAVYATQAIRNQIAIDSNFGANSGISPT